MTVISVSVCFAIHTGILKQFPGTLKTVGVMEGLVLHLLSWKWSGVLDYLDRDVQEQLDVQIWALGKKSQYFLPIMSHRVVVGNR